MASWGRGSSGVTASWGLSGESLPQHPLLGLSDASSCGWVLRTPPEAPHACPGEERISAKWLWATAGGAGRPLDQNRTPRGKGHAGRCCSPRPESIPGS